MAEGGRQGDLQQRIQEHKENRGKKLKSIEELGNYVDKEMQKIQTLIACTSGDKTLKVEPAHVDDTKGPKNQKKCKEIQFAIKAANDDRKVENELLQYIQKEIKQVVKIKPDFNWKERNQNWPLIVCCNYSSRIGADVEYAMIGVEEKEVILVVLHPTRKALIRGSLYDTDYLIADDFKKRVAFIAHFAFDDDKVFECEQNRYARDHICRELKDHVKQHF